MLRGIVTTILIVILFALAFQANAADRPTLAKIIVNREAIVGELLERTDKHVRILEISTNELRTINTDNFKSIRVDISEEEAALSVGLPEYLAWNIRRLTPTTGVNTVVVLPLCNASGQQTVEGRQFAENVTTELVRNDVRVVERTLLDKVLGELTLQNSRGFDSTTAQRIGKQLGGFVVLTGTIVKRRKGYVAQLRLIKVETGEILFAATHRILSITREPEVVRSVPWQPTRRSRDVIVVKPEPTKRSSPPEKPERVDLWTPGHGRYGRYHMPSLVKTESGILLAFCHDRKDGTANKKYLLMRRSTDGGQRWSPSEVVWEAENVPYCYPCSVVEKETGTILLLGISRGSSVWLLKSMDDGKTWNTAREITEAIKKPNWTWYCTGPGAGIQIQQGSHTGRLVIPCGHTEAGTKHYSHIIYSDDGGETWHLGGSTPKQQTVAGECEVVELSEPPGRLMLNMEDTDRSHSTRQTALSDDGGLTWHSQMHDPALIEPGCQASIRRLRWPGRGQRGVILFSNPASKSKREKMTVRVSYDDAKTWPRSMVVNQESSAFSCLTAIDDNTAGMVYLGAGRITFVRLNLSWLTRD